MDAERELTIFALRSSAMSISVNADAIERVLDDQKEALRRIQMLRDTAQEMRNAADLIQHRPES